MRLDYALYKCYALQHTCARELREVTIRALEHARVAKLGRPLDQGRSWFLSRSILSKTSDNGIQIEI